MHKAQDLDRLFLAVTEKKYLARRNEAQCLHNASPAKNQQNFPDAS